MKPGDFDVCARLSAYARKAGVLIVKLASKEPAGQSKAGAAEALMSDVGTRLFTLSSFLENPTSPIQPDIEEEARNVVLHLRRVFIRTASTELDSDPFQILEEIHMQLNDWDEKGRENCVVEYFQLAPPSDAKNLGLLCDRLRSKISSKDWHSTGSLPANVKVPEPNRYEESINKKLFETLKLHTRCVPDSHQDHELQVSIACVNMWHPTRLRLGGPFQCSKWAMFDVVTSSLKEGFWNEFRWFISTQNEEEQSSGSKPPRVKFKGDEDEAQYDPPTNSDSLEPGYICCALNPDETSLRIDLQLVPNIGLVEREDALSVEPLFPHEGVKLSSVLQSYYPLTVQDKITLAHTVAQAFWQLYASDLMQSVWTSENIWFMHEQNQDDRGNPVDEVPDKLPMNAYIVFNFGTVDDAVMESLETDPGSRGRQRPLPHRFPHILALGVLLLEIGLGIPVGKQETRALFERQHVVRVASDATSNLKRLKEISWDGFALHKRFFTGVIEYCTTYKDRINSEQRIVSEIEISKRKEQLYVNVIRPLAWLAQVFHEDNRNITCAYSSRVRYLWRREEPGKPDENVQSELAELLNSDDTSRWFDKMTKFNLHIYQMIEAKVKKPQKAEEPQKAHAMFKIAILDTGYNPQMPFFKVSGRLVKWQDFASEPPSLNGIDEHGHGSFMTQLVMASSPLAEVYVARVAKTSAHLSQNKHNIAQAIIWAGLTKQVNIISMSFGLEEDDDKVAEISKAIEKVAYERGGEVIFLAAASNDSSIQTNMFPARHPSVIPIHATNSKGTFIFNPSTSDTILGTFGEGIPDYILREIKHYFPTEKTGFEAKPSSSIATAIAAGIVATTLAHVSVLQWALPNQDEGNFNISAGEIVKKLRKQAGMEKMLHKMATHSGGNPHRLFIDPIAVWKRASKNISSPLEMDWNILKEMDHFLKS